MKNNKKKQKFIFFDFIDKQDRLVKVWFRELFVIFILCIISLVCVIDAISPWGIIAWIFVYVIATIAIGCMSATRTLIFYRLAIKSKKLVDQHTNEELKSIFRKSPRLLWIIFILDMGYPITWIFSFLIKVAFSANVQKMKNLILPYSNLENA